MFENPEQKKYAFISLLAIIALVAVTVWQRPSFQYKDSTNYSDQTQDQASQITAEAYARYLKSLNVDEKASQELFKKIISQQDIEREVRLALKTDQKVEVPNVPDESIKISEKSGQEAVTEYLVNALGPVVSFNEKTLNQNKQLFSADANTVDALIKGYESAYKKVLAVEVPKEGLQVQKALLAAYSSYGELLGLSEQYTAGSNNDPWAEVYKNYVVINDSFSSFNKEFDKLSDKYQLASAVIIYHDSDVENQQDARRFTLIPEAQAFLGIGDVTITVGDIPRIIKEAVEEGLTASFAQFLGSFIGNIIDKIESNYLIANFLYYSDALVQGQYVDDYLNKYVSTAFDRQVVKSFIPQFSCYKENESLKPLFRAKAQEYLGFNPVSVSPKDPEYYEKLARVGNFMASPEGWESYYESLAVQAESEAQRAAERELLSPGLKTPRDSVKKSISLSINGIVSAEQANLNAIMQLGISNAKTFISKFVANLTQTLVTKFVFKGAVPGGGTAGVFKEQSTCLAAAQIQAIVPAASAIYQEPPAAPDPASLIDQECAKLPRGCNEGPTGSETEPKITE